MALEIWINPACSKCRTALSELNAAGVEYVERRYLDDPPTSAELVSVLARLRLDPWDIARPKETREAGIDLPRDAEHVNAWIEALVEHPRALQRPIITGVPADEADTEPGSAPSAVLARDPETLRSVIERVRD